MPPSEDEIAPTCFAGPGKNGGKVCAVCDADIDPTDRHPVSVTMDDGVTIYLFCSPACRREWDDRTDG